ncbi:hypothetical protein [Dermatobacter hominis]|uniref:hypothetical protein n=1 Tax=Dermatobacter hominis TaxID=2884263 RepID=UPI001D101FEA|nr:hypothetical protein [Dermatobacter hominis]UDY35830.1 hypothetical protein LH044_21245 [Dermatobacter hominis]
MTATSRDDSPVAWTRIEVLPPFRPGSSGPGGYPGVVCEPAAPFEHALDAAQTYECTLPDVVPNGTWLVSATAGTEYVANYAGGADTSFEVTGGFDDHDAPELVSAVVSPNPVVIGQPFALTVRASDEHHTTPVPGSPAATIVLPAAPGASGTWSCTPVTPELVEPTVLEWRFTDCVVPAGSSPWTYAGRLAVADAYGSSAGLSIMFSAVAPPA